MSELEARKILNKYRNSWYNESDKQKVEVANALDVILTYPTQEEVIDEITKHYKQKYKFKFKISYDNETKSFLYDKITMPVIKSVICTSCSCYEGSVYFNDLLTLELMELIVKFYKGVLANDRA